jgi:hypothetical protein
MEQGDGVKGFKQKLDEWYAMPLPTQENALLCAPCLH